MSGEIPGLLMTMHLLRQYVNLPFKADVEVIRLLRHPRNETALFWPKDSASELNINKDYCKRAFQ